MDVLLGAVASLVVGYILGRLDVRRSAKFSERERGRQALEEMFAEAARIQRPLIELTRWGDPNALPNVALAEWWPSTGAAFEIYLTEWTGRWRLRVNDQAIAHTLGALEAVQVNINAGQESSGGEALVHFYEALVDHLDALLVALVGHDGLRQG